MDLSHLGQNVLGTAGITKPPACHGISLGETIDQNGTIPHARKGCDGDMLIAVSQFGINLIGDHEQVMLFDQGRDGLEILTCHDGTCRVIRERQDQNLGLFCNGFFQFRCRQAELIFSLQFNDHRFRTCQDCAGLIGYIGRLRDQHLFPFPGIDHGTQCQVDGFGTTHCYQHFFLRLIADADPSLQIIADLRTQLHQTGIGGIKGASFFQGINTLIPDMPGRIKVRFAHAKGNGIRHFRHKVKKLTNPGGF